MRSGMRSGYAEPDPGNRVVPGAQFCTTFTDAFRTSREGEPCSGTFVELNQVVRCRPRGHMQA